jgi:nitrogen fixation protein FixH
MTPSSALPFRKPKARRLLPHWVPMLFVAGFLVVIGVNATLIIFAQDTFSGLETASPYERGLDYNKALAAQAEQDRLGWQAQAKITGENGVRSLVVRMTDRDGRPMDGLALSAYLVRPANEGLDLTISPRPMGGGRYVAEFALPADGQWELRLVAQSGDAVWQHSERLFVK